MNRIITAARAVWARAVVLAHAAPTFIVAASALLTYATAELAPLLPAGWLEVAGHVVGYALAWVGAAAAIVRRVSPVPPAKRGILPVRRRDARGRFTGAGGQSVVTVLLVVVLVLLILWLVGVNVQVD